MGVKRDTIRGQQRARWLLYQALHQNLGWRDTSNTWLAPFVKAWTRNEDGLYIAPVIVDFPCDPRVHWTYERKQEFHSHLVQVIPGWWETEFHGEGYVRATLMTHHVEVAEEGNTMLYAGDEVQKYDRYHYPPHDLLYTQLREKRRLIRSVLRGVFLDGWKETSNDE